MKLPKFPEDKGNQRFWIALIVAVLVTFVVWGAWMSVGFVLGALGWLFSTIGNGLQSAMHFMTGTHEGVFWFALGSGVILGAILAFNVRVDRMWNRLVRRRRVGGDPDPTAHHPPAG